MATSGRPPVGPWTPTWWNFPITTTFGAPTAGDPLRPHLGVDFAAPLGTPIQAAGVGKVSKVFSDQQGGNQVQVKYAQGGTGWFAHLADVLVAPGEPVTPASLIGHSGMSGTAVTGPHLHFQLLDQSGVSVDPITSFTKLVSQNGSFKASGDCPTGWHRGSMGGAGFCVPDGLMFGGGDLGKNVADAAAAVTPDLGKLNLGLPSLGLGGPDLSWLPQAFRSENLWRAGFVIIGAFAVFIGGRMYLMDSEAPRVEAVPHG